MPVLLDRDDSALLQHVRAVGKNRGQPLDYMRGSRVAEAEDDHAGLPAACQRGDLAEEGVHMTKTATATRKRVNITLATDTLRLLDRVAPKGDRSRLIDQAVRSYISAKSRTALRELLKEGAEARSQRDLGLAAEWFGVDSETWPGRKRGK